MQVMEKTETMEEEDTLQGKYLTFSIGSDVFGIAIRNVTEIIGMQPVTAVPDVPPYVKGIINLRGRIIPVVDIRLRFGREEAPYGERTSVIVVEYQDMVVGLIVDSVSEVLLIPDDSIVPPPTLRGVAQNRFVSGIGKVGDTVKLIVSCESLLDAKDAAAAVSVTEKEKSPEQG